MKEMIKRFIAFCIIAMFAQYAWSQFSIDLSHIESGVRDAAERARQGHQQGQSHGSGYSNQPRKLTKDERRMAQTDADNAARWGAAKVKTDRDMDRVHEEAAMLSKTANPSDFFGTDLSKMKAMESKQNGLDRAKLMETPQEDNSRTNLVWEHMQESARETTERWLSEKEKRGKKNCALELSECIGNSRPVPVWSNNNEVKRRQNPKTGNQLKTINTKKYDSSMRMKNLNQQGLIINNENREGRNVKYVDSKTAPVGTKTLVDNSNQSIPNCKLEKPKMISRVVSNQDNNTQQNVQNKTPMTNNPAKRVSERFHQMVGGRGIDISGVESNKWIDVHLDQKRLFQDGGPFQRDENGEINYIQYINGSYKGQVILNGFEKINEKR